MLIWITLGSLGLPWVHMSAFQVNSEYCLALLGLALLGLALFGLALFCLALCCFAWLFLSMYYVCVGACVTETVFSQSLDYKRQKC